MVNVFDISNYLLAIDFQGELSLSLPLFQSLLGVRLVWEQGRNAEEDSSVHLTGILGELVDLLIEAFESLTNFIR